MAVVSRLYWHYLGSSDYLSKLDKKALCNFLSGNLHNMRIDFNGKSVYFDSIGNMTIKELGQTEIISNKGKLKALLSLFRSTLTSDVRIYEARYETFRI